MVTYAHSVWSNIGSYLLLESVRLLLKCVLRYVRLRAHALTREVRNRLRNLTAPSTSSTCRHYTFMAQIDGRPSLSVYMQTDYMPNRSIVCALTLDSISAHYVTSCYNAVSAQVLWAHNTYTLVKFDATERNQFSLASKYKVPATYWTFWVRFMKSVL